MWRNFKGINKCVFGQGAFKQLEAILSQLKTHSHQPLVFLLDDHFENKDLHKRIPAKNKDIIILINVDDEPSTMKVDALVEEIKTRLPELPASVVGIGGGSLMDYAKAISLMLCNPGSSSDYQGLDLIKNKGVHCTVVPTLSGTGAEVSMTAVLTGPEKKLGIKCDYTVPDQLVLDPELIAQAPNPQRFYTAMDCYIHNAESMHGTWRNTLSDAYAEISQKLCREVFLFAPERNMESEEKLMIASYLGGLSLTFSQVGVCHALSYGLSYVLHSHHGIANCIIFNHLEDYYPKEVEEFHQMLEKHKIALPENVCSNLGEEELMKMALTAYNLDHMWDHAFGKDWKKHLSIDKIIDLYKRM
jgi:3-deoxy-alpha-D-manno-octulosonate 8-oxidase